MRIINRDLNDQARCEQIDVEVCGGPWDGTRMILDVVGEGPNEIRVLEQGFTWKHPVLRAADVERRGLDENRTGGKR